MSEKKWKKELNDISNDLENAEDPTGSVDTVIVRDGTPAQGGTEIPPENTYDGGGGRGGNPNSPGEDLIDAPPSKDTPAPQGGGQTASTEATTTGLLEQNENNEANPDESAIPPDEPEPISVGGRVLVQFLYMPNANKINLSLIRVGDMPPPERGGSENIQVHLCILPQRKQRCRTKAVPTSKGVFNETFQFIHMTKDVVERCAIRIRVYGTQRFSKRLIGETRIPLSQVDLTGPLCDETIWKNLSPKGLVVREERFIHLLGFFNLFSLEVWKILRKHPCSKIRWWSAILPDCGTHVLKSRSSSSFLFLYTMFIYIAFLAKVSCY